MGRLALEKFLTPMQYASFLFSFLFNANAVCQAITMSMKRGSKNVFENLHGIGDITMLGGVGCNDFFVSVWLSRIIPPLSD